MLGGGPLIKWMWCCVGGALVEGGCNRPFLWYQKVRTGDSDKVYIHSFYFDKLNNIDPWVIIRCLVFLFFFPFFSFLSTSLVFLFRFCFWSSCFLLVWISLFLFICFLLVWNLSFSWAAGNQGILALIFHLRIFLEESTVMSQGSAGRVQTLHGKQNQSFRCWCIVSSSEIGLLFLTQLSSKCIGKS